MIDYNEVDVRVLQVYGRGANIKDIDITYVDYGVTYRFPYGDFWEKIMENL